MVLPHWAVFTGGEIPYFIAQSQVPDGSPAVRSQAIEVGWKELAFESGQDPGLVGQVMKSVNRGHGIASKKILHLTNTDIPKLSCQFQNPPMPLRIPSPFSDDKPGVARARTRGQDSRCSIRSASGSRCTILYKSPSSCHMHFPNPSQTKSASKTRRPGNRI